MKNCVSCALIINKFRRYFYRIFLKPSIISWLDYFFFILGPVLSLSGFLIIINCAFFPLRGKDYTTIVLLISRTRILMHLHLFWRMSYAMLPRLQMFQLLRVLTTKIVWNIFFIYGKFYKAYEKKRYNAFC